MTDSPKTALVVVDVLNHYEHDDAEALTRSVRETLPAMRSLVEAARAAGTLTIYINDHHGDWAASRESIVARAGRGRAPDLVTPLTPPDDAPFLVKARHSAFYGTQLEHLLRKEGVERVMLTGQVTEQCVLYSALDAYVRELAVAVPRDAVAHIDPELADAALRMMETNMSAEILDGDAAAESLRAG